MIIRLADRSLQTRFGVFDEILFYDGLSECIALVMGEVRNEDDVLVRIHSSCISAHVFNSIECTCREEMEAAQTLIGQNGRGVVIWLDQEGKGNGHLALIESIKYKRQGFDQAEAYVKAGYRKDGRDYRPAADVLNEIGVRSVILLTDNQKKADELRDHSITVSAIRPLD